MSELEHSQDGNLRVAFATWVYLLHAAGHGLADDRLVAECEAVAAATDAAAGDAAGLELIEHIAARIDAGGSEPEQVAALARALVGDDVTDALGQGDRDTRTARIRTYQFGRGLPWLARIWERDASGGVAPSWLLVEQVTDRVLIMDPNPWNDIDEERSLPVSDFQVLWELDGCTSVAVA